MVSLALMILAVFLALLPNCVPVCLGVVFASCMVVIHAAVWAVDMLLPNQETCIGTLMEVHRPDLPPVTLGNHILSGRAQLTGNLLKQRSKTSTSKHAAVVQLQNPGLLSARKLHQAKQTYLRVNLAANKHLQLGPWIHK